jgi:hypothetical protein
MQEMSTQSDSWSYLGGASSLEESRSAHMSRVEEQNKRLQTLLCELLQKNHELRLKVAHPA